MSSGYLILENGKIFEGTLLGNNPDVMGEVVFNTSMTGYQEIITDPSYAGQILTFCYPTIGNYGINLFDNESNQPQLKGVVLGDVCEKPSHFLSKKSFAEQLEEAGIPGITGVDTRDLVKLIRKEGTIKGMITSSIPAKHALDQLWKKDNICWVSQVSTNEIITYHQTGPHVALIDYGSKKSIIEALLKENCKVTVVPYDFTFEQMKALNPDGILLSNGPGDPMMLNSHFFDIKKMVEQFPTLGICLGHQLIALAFGAKTEKLTYGHRGGNHPVKDLQSGKVSITSQNHGYVVVKDTIDQNIFEITFQNVNDGSVEGLKHLSHPIQTVQFHPEAHPGPSDTEYIFRNFILQLEKVGDMKYAIT
ncbi:carbamoyl phosphate synthase small subunit [Rossellomorea sp. BNER]|uniref:carbamoyl phosphate synthase small subunit n=1 Tax=Rossellomorea sp. BNER TaxID=2962031 RepID=UPI003AF2CEC3|nr:carbamoyl phosphate synthase small subunit [Rossellomorea sp. BNER]